jgi:hypothetical protein
VLEPRGGKLIIVCQIGLLQVAWAKHLHLLQHLQEVSPHPADSGSEGKTKTKMHLLLHQQQEGTDTRLLHRGSSGVYDTMHSIVFDVYMPRLRSITALTSSISPTPFSHPIKSGASKDSSLPCNISMWMLCVPPRGSEEASAEKRRGLCGF